MRAALDTRHGWPLWVTLRMTLPELHETVEWLGTVAADDPVTAHWRAELARINNEKAARDR
jgi:hypothetical protein